MRPQIVIFKWNLERRVMIPLPRFHNVCGRQFEDGKDYPMDVHQERSRASHNQYFAAVNEMFINLPEKTAKQFPTSEYLRKWALVRTGWYVEKNFACKTEGHARNLASFIRKVDDYAVIAIKGDVVRVFEAKSQSIPAMGKEDFEKSKHDVLDLVSSMVGVTATQAKRQAGRSA